MLPKILVCTISSVNTTLGDARVELGDANLALSVKKKNVNLQENIKNKNKNKNRQHVRRAERQPKRKDGKMKRYVCCVEGQITMG